MNMTTYRSAQAPCGTLSFEAAAAAVWFAEPENSLRSLSFSEQRIA
ncbi:hypothetical protein [Paraburkholderia ultramafica]|nr:hypothetical protein [Paraburkholderia ultramafica]